LKKLNQNEIDVMFSDKNKFDELNIYKPLVDQMGLTKDTFNKESIIGIINSFLKE
jgi:hypothetical protein